MRLFALLFSALLVCCTPVPGQTEGDDPYDLKLVQANLRIASRGAVELPSVAKNFQRLGDGVSIALLKILDEQELTKPNNVQALLPLIRQSFSYPSIISVGANKKPGVTLFLLSYLQRNISDAEIKREIRETISFVKEKSGS